MPDHNKFILIQLPSTRASLLFIGNIRNERVCIRILGNDLYVVGKNRLGRSTDLGESDFNWDIARRDGTSGELLAEFGEGGAIQHNPSPRHEQPMAVTADKGSIYIAGDDRGVGDSQWRIEKRDAANGNLVAGFGSGGVVVTNMGSRYACAEKIWVDTEYLYVGGWEQLSGAGSQDWRVDKRSKSTGKLVPEFGKNGILRKAGTTGYSNWLVEMEVNRDCLYLLTACHRAAKARWCIEKRNKVTAGRGPE